MYDPVSSFYKACFSLSKSASVMANDHHQFFPHRNDYVNKPAERGAGLTRYEFDYDDSYLYLQSFVDNRIRADASGSLILSTSVTNLSIRFNADGKDGDTWDFKDLNVRLALVDATAPIMRGISFAPGIHARGNDLYISVAFNEIVTDVSASLTTSWGTLTNFAGSGSNVLTFKGTIKENATGLLNITGQTGTITDLAGNVFSGSLACNGLCQLDANNVYSISYDLDGGNASNPATYTYDDADITLANPIRTGYKFQGWSGTEVVGRQQTVTIAAHSHGDRQSYSVHDAQRDGFG